MTSTPASATSHASFSDTPLEAVHPMNYGREMTGILHNLETIADNSPLRLSPHQQQRLQDQEQQQQGGIMTFASNLPPPSDALLHFDHPFSVQTLTFANSRVVTLKRTPSFVGFGIGIGLLSDPNAGLHHFVTKNGDRGVKIDLIPKGSPAEATGLKVGDEILAIDGKDILKMTLQELGDMVRHAGQEMQVVIALPSEEGAGIGMGGGQRVSFAPQPQVPPPPPLVAQNSQQYLEQQQQQMLYRSQNFPDFVHDAFVEKSPRFRNNSNNNNNNNSDNSAGMLFQPRNAITPTAVGGAFDEDSSSRHLPLPVELRTEMLRKKGSRKNLLAGSSPADALSTNAIELQLAEGYDSAEQSTPRHGTHNNNNNDGGHGHYTSSSSNSSGAGGGGGGRKSLQQLQQLQQQQQQQQQLNAVGKLVRRESSPSMAIGVEVTMNINNGAGGGGGGFGFSPFSITLCDARRGRQDSEECAELLRACSFVRGFLRKRRKIAEAVSPRLDEVVAAVVSLTPKSLYLGDRSNPPHFSDETEEVPITEEEGVVVQAVVPGGIAHCSGLRSWDVIVAVNDVDLDGMDLTQAVQILRSTPSPVTLSVIRSLNPPRSRNFTTNDGEMLITLMIDNTEISEDVIYSSSTNSNLGMSIKPAEEELVEPAEAMPNNFNNNGNNMDTPTNGNGNGGATTASSSAASSASTMIIRRVAASQVASRWGGVVVAQLKDNGIARRAGVCVGDVIVEANGIDLRPLSFSESSLIIFSAPSLVLKVIREAIPSSNSSSPLILQQQQQQNHQNQPFPPSSFNSSPPRRLSTDGSPPKPPPPGAGSDAYVDVYPSTDAVLKTVFIQSEGGFGFSPHRHSLCDAAAPLLPPRRRATREEIFNLSQSTLSQFKLEPFFFAVKWGGGWPIISVDPLGPAARGGLKSGDVIIVVNGVDVRRLTGGEIAEMISKTSELRLQVVRMRSGGGTGWDALGGGPGGMLMGQQLAALEVSLSTHKRRGVGCCVGEEREGGREGGREFVVDSNWVFSSFFFRSVVKIQNWISRGFFVFFSSM